MSIRQTIDRELRLWLIGSACLLPIAVIATLLDWTAWVMVPVALLVNWWVVRYFDPPWKRRQRRCKGDHEFMARAAAEHGDACGAVRATCGGCDLVLWERDS